MKKFTKRQLQVLYYFAQNSGVAQGTKIDSISYSRRSGLWEVWYLDHNDLLNYKISRDLVEWR